MTKRNATRDSESKFGKFTLRVSKTPHWNHATLCLIKKRKHLASDLTPNHTNAMKRAVYAGTFDPVTNGHLDILSRACRIFDEVIVAVAPNLSKSPLFTVEERIALLAPNLENLPNAHTAVLDGLTVDFAREHGASAIIRGLRAVSDFEYEFQMAQMNRHLDEDIETLFLMPSEDFFFTSSNLIKAVARYSQDRLEKFIPQNVAEALRTRVSE
jgi:pantetheine-phosphate adenylyltransferase